jgi:hypothetical protein
MKSQMGGLGKLGRDQIDTGRGPVKRRMNKHSDEDLSEVD